MSTLTHPAREANRAENRTSVTPMSQFSNEPMIDWSNPENLRRMQAALDKVRSELGREYDLVIGGRRVKTGDTFAVPVAMAVAALPRHIIGKMTKQGGPASSVAVRKFSSRLSRIREENFHYLKRLRHEDHTVHHFQSSLRGALYPGQHGLLLHQNRPAAFA